jgi:putative CocE/NonD family hydrolase
MVTCAAASASPPAPELTYLREHYTKYEYNVPMRDGVHLFTAVYVPKNNDKLYPILLTRTPYAVKPYGEDVSADPHGPMNDYAKEGFIFVLQDVRGKNGSEGTFVNVRPILESKPTPKDVDESTDAYDTIDWLVKNVPNNNGNVGMMGISYPGFYAACGMIDSHPALKCVSPQAPIADWFMGDDLHHNGALFLADTFGFLASFGQKLEDPLRESAKDFDFKTRDGYQFYLGLGPIANADKNYLKGKIEFWNEALDHPNYDTFWQSRSLGPHLRNVHAAVMTVGGWYDAEDLCGTLTVYKETARLNPSIYNVLVMGPWSHGEWSSPDGDRLGNVEFNAKTAQYYREHFEMPFLKHFLKGDEKDDKTADNTKGEKFNLSVANVFETGTNQWRHFDAWPPKNAADKALYLHANGRLSFDPPTDDENSSFDEYVSDPAKPVPNIGYVALQSPREYMVDDQRFAATRPDVLVYQTDVLKEDVTFAGPISAHLHVSTSGTDSDFVVKLIDVYSGDFPNPDPNPNNVQMGGYQQLVRGEPMRGKFRNSYEKPEPFTPGQTTAVNWTMPDIFHTFRRSHRIMIQIQSSWFPLVDRNPQTFCDINQAAPNDFQKATERVYHSPQAASEIGVRVLTTTDRFFRATSIPLRPHPADE